MSLSPIYTTRWVPGRHTAAHVCPTCNQPMPRHHWVEVLKNGHAWSLACSVQCAAVRWLRKIAG